MIVVTGATGLLGSQIVRHLLDRVPADRVGVSVRDPGRAGDLTARGVRVRRGDYTDPASLADAFEGARQVLVISANMTGEQAIAANTAAIDAARAAGAQRVLYTSHQAAAMDSAFPPMPTHAATEAHLAATGAPFTALRNGFYAASVPVMLGQALQTGRIIAPADGPVSWTAHADLAEAAAIVLAGEGRFDGPTPPLTAPHAFDLADVAALLSEMTGRTIRRDVVGDDEYAATMTTNGAPAGQIAMVLGLFRAARHGEFAATAPDLEKLLGRPATPLRTVLEQTVAAR